MDKKQEQLGMSPSTASGRLVKDIMWALIMQTGKDDCYCCGEKMNRETFSIEHKTPWLDSEDPVGLYFDLDNISFSHLKCNVGAARRPAKQGCGHIKSYSRGCRCDLCKQAAATKSRKHYKPEVRSERYKRLGA